MRTTLRALLQRLLSEPMATRLACLALERVEDPLLLHQRLPVSAASQEWSLLTLRRLGFAPRVAVDIGAHRGDWTRMFRRQFPGTRVLMVEPQQALRPGLDAVAAELGGGVEVRTALLGAEAGAQVDFHVTQGLTGASVLPEQSDVPRWVERQQLQTLDLLVADTDFARADLLKLDVQGYELAVLTGGPRTLAHAEVVQLEVSLWPYNAGAPLLDEVLRFMADAGLRAFDISGLHRRPEDGVLLQADVLFVREGSALLSRVQTRWSP